MRSFKNLEEIWKTLKKIEKTSGYTDNNLIHFSSCKLYKRQQIF